jgi:serine/threonine-protein kinase|nr:serine/threonine-protein kinase [Kofleriaceae bacterium]
MGAPRDDASTFADGVAGRVRAAPRQTIGRFEIRRTLGEGGMGIVYDGYDARLDRPVAIKLVRLAGDGGTQGRARLMREAQAMAKVAHPNVVPIYEVGEHDDQVFVAMELVDGEPLSAWQRRAARSWRDTLAIHVAAGRGLAAAHAVGIVHRDYKPDNVLVGRDGRPRVLDFGLARGVAAPSPLPSPSPDDPSRPPRTAGAANVLDLELTAAGSMMGTPGYMSPEHFRGDNIGPAADQFGFAVAVYRALFGAAPFAGDTLGELRASVCAGELRAPTGDPELPASVVAAIVRSLSAAPGDRFASMDALLAELERPLQVDPAHDPARGRRGRRIGAALLSIGALASLVGTTLASSLDTSPGWIVAQSALAVTMLSLIGFVLRKSLVTSAHNRRVGAVMLVTAGGFLVHRAVALLLGSPARDTLVGDAVMLGVVTVIAGIVFERWMIAGGPIALVYLAVAVALPEHAGPAFGGLVFVYAVAAAWRWGRA